MSVAETIVMLIMSAIKFAMTIPVYVFNYELSFLETITYSSAGGIAGVLFFALLTDILVKLWNRYLSDTKFEKSLINIYNKLFVWKKEKKVFSRRNKMIVKTRNKYGLIGLAILTPSLLSIPLGTFITLRYYPNYFITICYLIASVLVWSVIFTLIYIFF